MTKEEYLALAASKWESLEELKKETSFYEYEKKFERIMLDLSREVLDKELMGKGEDRRKKKVRSRFGMIRVDKAHTFYNSLKHSNLSPYLRELFLYVGQEDNYHNASEFVEKFLGIKSNSMQIQRQVMAYGDMVGALLEEEVLLDELHEEERVYAMMDGSMLLTRPSAWQEVKIGRVFKESSICFLDEKRKEVRESDYAAHLGNHQEFEEKMSLLVDKYEFLGKNLVFINDGAKWIWNWIKSAYPNATQILDFYHVVEHLSTFAKCYFKTEKAHLTWVERIKGILKTQGVNPVIEFIKNFKTPTKKIKKEKEKLLNYCQNNAQRMQYHQYLEKGLVIGSGAIEAAHRTISQKRLKQSGQRWSKKGAQNVLNLRVLNKSNRWHQLQNIMQAA